MSAQLDGTLRPGPGRFPSRAPGCDAPGDTAPLYMGARDPVTGERTWVCRCGVCARCGRHTGNSNQGHYWRMCKASGGISARFHFCCGEEFGCELVAWTKYDDGTLPVPKGMDTVFGTGVSYLGEDCNRAVLLGHPSPRRAVATVQRFERVYTGERTLPFASLAEAVEKLAPRWQWATFATRFDCEEQCPTVENYTDTDGVARQYEEWCERCAHLRDGGWWLNMTDEKPDRAGAFPVTTVRLW